MCARRRSTSGSVSSERGLVLGGLRELRKRAGLSQEDLAGFGARAGLGPVSRKHISEAETGAPVGPRTAALLAKKLSAAYGDERRVTVEDLVGTQEDRVGPEAVAEWEPAAPPGPFTLAPNGLQWCVQKLKHKTVRNRFGCGKLYDLSHLSSTHQLDFQRYLVGRHAEVCDRVGAHPNIARNLTVHQDPLDNSKWWVVDEFIDGERLSARLSRGALPDKVLRSVMKDIAEGLHALHNIGVIRRQLSPYFVIIDKERATLTDFELAKLLDGSPTVNVGTWPYDPYVAPEVRAASKEIDASCDLYSWAMILAHAASGEVPITSEAALAVLKTASLPKALHRIAIDALDQPRSKRPNDVKKVLRLLQKWEAD